MTILIVPSFNTSTIEISPVFKSVLGTSVKYNVYLYQTEDECVNAQANFMNYYEKKSDDYKKITVVDTHCIEFESFPIARFNPSGA